MTQRQGILERPEEPNAFNRPGAWRLPWIQCLKQAIAGRNFGSAPSSSFQHEDSQQPCELVFSWTVRWQTRGWCLSGSTYSQFLSPRAQAAVQSELPQLRRTLLKLLYRGNVDQALQTMKPDYNRAHTFATEMGWPELRCHSRLTRLGSLEGLLSFSGLPKYNFPFGHISLFWISWSS